MIVQNLFPTPSFALCFRSPFLRTSLFDNKFSQEVFFQNVFPRFIAVLHREMEARTAANEQRRYIK